jgi:cation diffusion facilitator family transporter
MDECCAVRIVPAEQRRVLQIVLGVNLVMFIAECVAGLLAHSTALLADSVDMLGDAIVYGFSLYSVNTGPVGHARAALLKGSIMALFGAGVLVEVVLKIAHGIVPAADVMGGLGLVALAANSACLAMLWRRRADDINMRSAWLCSRNDVLANVGVLLAALGVGLTQAAWPDIAVGLAIAVLFASSAFGVLREAGRARRQAGRAWRGRLERTGPPA